MNVPLPDSVRRTANRLGYAGLIPFVVLAPASLLDAHHGITWSDALFAYGAVILSFVCALHWGFAMALPGLDERTRVRSLLWSVVPSLIAWPALLLVPSDAAVLLTGLVRVMLSGRERRIRRARSASKRAMSTACGSSGCCRE